MSKVGTIAFRTVVGLTVGFLLLPAVVVVVMSFADTTYLSFPPDSWGMRQYTELAGSEEWKSATVRSLIVAIPTALLTVVAAALLTLGLRRTRLRFENAFIGFATLPILVPGVALAVALYESFARVGLLDTYLGVILAHSAITLPLAVLVMWPAMRSISNDLELVAMTLGAQRVRAWLEITARLLVPALAAAAILVFLTSFDEATLVSFITGPDTTTLPKAILDSVITGVDPIITAIASLLIAATAVLMTAAEVLRKRSTQR